ncbi:MAG: Uma2 family endonuclease, partial [Cyanobacteria bacterium J06641_2]
VKSPKFRNTNCSIDFKLVYFWRFNGNVLRIYVLNDGQYLEVEQSPTFGSVGVKEIPRFIQETRINGEMATTRAFRAWVREQV